MTELPSVLLNTFFWPSSWWTEPLNSLPAPYHKIKFSQRPNAASNFLTLTTNAQPFPSYVSSSRQSSLQHPWDRTALVSHLLHSSSIETFIVSCHPWHMLPKFQTLNVPSVLYQLLPRGFTRKQTDDTASAGYESVINRGSKMASRFEYKPATMLNDIGRITFNDVEINMDNVTYSIAQPSHIELELLSKRNVDKCEFAVQRAWGAYIAAVGRPVLTTSFAHASKTIAPDRF